MSEKKASRHRELGTLAKVLIEEGIDVHLEKAQLAYQTALKAAWPKADEKLVDAIMEADRPIDECRRAIVAILDGNFDRAREILGL